MKAVPVRRGSAHVSTELRRPDLFIIGAAKCGTTSLYQYLAGHPEIYMSPDKEPQYFAPDLATEILGRTLRHPDDHDRYLALFAGARDERRLGEASVRYIYSEQAPGLVRQFQPDARIVVMIRDPVDMMHSLHAHYVAGAIEQITDFGRAFAAEADRRHGRRVRRGVHPALLLYSERARFGRQLTRWFETFPREQIHVIVFEDFAAGPEHHFRRLLEFLEVDPDYQPPSFGVHNPRHAPRSQALLAVESARPLRILARRVISQPLRDSLRRRVIRPLRMLNRKRVDREPMPAALRQRLRQELAPDVELLSHLLDRDLAELWWKGRDDARRVGRRKPIPAG